MAPSQPQFWRRGVFQAMFLVSILCIVQYILITGLYDTSGAAMCVNGHNHSDVAVVYENICTTPVPVARRKLEILDYDDYDAHWQTAIKNSNLPNEQFTYVSPYCQTRDCSHTRNAYVLSGRLRSFWGLFPSHYENVLTEIQPDVFILTECPSKVTNKEQGIRLLRTLFSLFKPRAIVVEKADHMQTVLPTLEECRKQWPLINAKETPLNILTMYYRIHASNQLKKDWEQSHGFVYDLVIRSRFDHAYTQPFHIPSVIPEKTLFLTYYNKYVPQPEIGDADPWDMLAQQQDPVNITELLKRPGAYLNDNIGFGNSETMDIYSSIWPNFDAVYNGCATLQDVMTELQGADKIGEFYTPEAYLASIVYMNDIKLVELPFFLWTFCSYEVCHEIFTEMPTHIKIKSFEAVGMDLQCNRPCEKLQ